MRNLEHMFMLKEQRVLSKDLSFQYKKDIYQIKTKYIRTFRGKKVDIFESEGKVKMVLLEGKVLEYSIWKENIAEPTKILDVKELETRWPDRKIQKPGKHHAWR